jgi:hypothetical protein
MVPSPNGPRIPRRVRVQPDLLSRFPEQNANGMFYSTSHAPRGTSDQIIAFIESSVSRSNFR